jgi:hypothetical protein
MKEWKKARHKPTVINYRETNPIYQHVPHDVWIRACKNNISDDKNPTERMLEVEKLDNPSGILYAFPELDYVIKGVEGKLYPIKKEVFERVYERIDE